MLPITGLGEWAVRQDGQYRSEGTRLPDSCEHSQRRVDFTE